MKLASCIVLAIFILTSAPTIRAADNCVGSCFVDCTNGDDALGNGTDANPWRTLSNAAMQADQNETLYVRNGPCKDKNIRFSTSRTTVRGCPGPDQCNPLPPPIIVQPEDGAPENSFGFLIRDGLIDFTIENFKITDNPANTTAPIFKGPVKILGGVAQTTERITLRRIEVEKTAAPEPPDPPEAGIKIENGSIATMGVRDVTMEDCFVHDSEGNGYSISTKGTPSLVQRVTFRRAKATNNAMDGFVVSGEGSASKGRNITFEVTESTGNQGDGYDVEADVTDASQMTRFIGVIATGNGDVGIKVRHSFQIENSYVAGSTNAGIAAAGIAATQRNRMFILNTTVKDNGTGMGGPQIRLNAPDDGGTAPVDLRVFNTIATSSAASIPFLYYKPPSATIGSSFSWDFDLFHRSGTPAVRYVVNGLNLGCSTATEIKGCDCVSATQVQGCDSAADCDRDGHTTVNEVLAGVNIALGNQAIGTCLQADWNATGEVEILDLIIAVGHDLGDPIRGESLTAAPLFDAVDQKHQTSASPGWNQGDVASSVSGVTVCRADICDQDGHERPRDLVRDIGAYEGSRLPAAPQNSTCLAALSGTEPCFAAGGAAAGPTSLTVGSVTGCRGALVQIPVTMSGSLEPAGGAQLDMLYDTAVLSVPNPTSPCTLDAAGMPAGSLKTSFPTSPPPPPGKARLRVLLVDTANLTTFGNGQLFRCQFQIKSDAPVGSSTVAGEKQLVGDADGEAFVTTISNGAVTVTTTGCGCN